MLFKALKLIRLQASISNAEICRKIRNMLLNLFSIFTNTTFFFDIFVMVTGKFPPRKIPSSEFFSSKVLKFTSKIRNFPRGEFSGEGIFQGGEFSEGGVFRGGNFPGAEFPRGGIFRGGGEFSKVRVFLEPFSML